MLPLNSSPGRHQAYQVTCPSLSPSTTLDRGRDLVPLTAHFLSNLREKPGYFIFFLTCKHTILISMNINQTVLFSTLEPQLAGQTAGSWYGKRWHLLRKLDRFQSQIAGGSEALSLQQRLYASRLTGWSSHIYDSRPTVPESDACLVFVLHRHGSGSFMARRQSTEVLAEAFEAVKAGVGKSIVFAVSPWLPGKNAKVCYYLGNEIQAGNTIYFTSRSLSSPPAQSPG